MAGLPVRDTVWTVRTVPTFRRNILPPSSGLTIQNTTIDIIPAVGTSNLKKLLSFGPFLQI
jgi:hypothetical protein